MRCTAALVAPGLLLGFARGASAAVEFCRSAFDEARVIFRFLRERGWDRITLLVGTDAAGRPGGAGL